jgi:rod shape-determining protein MreD
MTVLGSIRVFGAAPDLGAMLVIFIAIFFGWGYSLEAGFVFGLLKDIYSLDIFGVNTVSLALTGLIAGTLSNKLIKESRLTQVLMVLVFTLVYFFIHYLIASAITDISYIKLSEYLFLSFIPDSLYTAAVSSVAFPFLIKRFALKETAEYL